jgi:hypothetical protein
VLLVASLRLAIAQASDGVGPAVPRRVEPEPLVWRVEPMMVATAAAATAAAVVVAVGEKEPARQWVQTLPVVVVAEEVVVAAVARRTTAVVRARSGRRSSSVASGHSGTLPCLRLGNSSRLLASIRSPATSF